MTVNELLKQEIDIDVYDDVCEELGIAFCGPMGLTEKGREKFSYVLDEEVEMFGTDYCVVKINQYPEGIWQKKLNALIELFESLAGFCPYDEYDEWFKEI